MIENCCIEKSKIIHYKSEFEKLSSPIEEFTDILCLNGNRIRFKILYLLMNEGGVCVNDICEIFDMSFPAISQHLRKLKDFGLIKNKKSGQFIIYSLNKKYQNVLNEVFKLYAFTKKDLYKLV